MKFDYTDHAEENIQERKLDKKIVEKVVKHPEKVTEGKFGRKIAQKISGSKLLRVVYEQKGNVYIIVTAYYTKHERYRWDTMKITYDPRADAMNIKFQEGTYDISKEVAEGIIIDYTKEGKVIRIELLDASKRMPKESIKNVVVGMPVSAEWNVSRKSDAIIGLF